MTGDERVVYRVVCKYVRPVGSAGNFEYHHSIVFVLTPPSKIRLVCSSVVH